MALLVSHGTGIGKTLAITLERLSDGAEWRQAATAAWEAAGTSTFDDRKVTMTEGLSDKAGSYTCSVSGLGDAGDVRVRVHDEGDSNRAIGVGEVRVIAGFEESDWRVIHSGTLQSALSNSATLAADTPFTSTTIFGCLIVITSGPGVGHVRSISSYSSSTKVAGIDINWQGTTPDSTSKYKILAAREAGVVSASSSVAARALDDGGAALARSSTLATVSTNVSSIITSLSAVATNVTSILAIVGTTGVAIATAVCQKIAHVVLRRTMTNVEGSADGDTLDKNTLYGLVQQAQNASRSGTTMTVKKTDDTTLGTLTLAVEDDADPIVGVS